MSDTPLGEKFPGQQMSPAVKAKAVEALNASVREDDVQAAAAFTEVLLAWLTDEAEARGLDTAQRIFAISLATINLRQHLPESLGGKAKFDACAHAAWQYYDANK